MEPAMIRRTDSGSILRVWVVPGASRSAIVGRHDNALKVRVTSPAERRRANDELIRLLAHHLGCRVTLVSGHRARSKAVLLHDLSVEAATRLLRT